MNVVFSVTQAVRDAFEKELDNHEQIKSVANVYLNKRECSVQGCVYHILPVNSGRGKHFLV